MKFTANMAKNPQDARIYAKQFQELSANRQQAEVGFGAMKSLALNAGLIKPTDKQIAVNEQIDLLYREIDNVTMMEPKPRGTQALFSRLLSNAIPTNIANKVVKARRTGEIGVNANVSMDGESDFVVGTTASNYQGCIVPVYDIAYGISWRDYAATQKDQALDKVGEDSIEAEYTLYEKSNDLLWNGTDLVVDGVSWGGIKGGESTIATNSMTVNLATSTSMTDIIGELIVQRNVLAITNRVDQGMDLAVSPQIMANWMRPGSANDAAFGSILMAVKAFMPDFVNIYEDSNLQNNQILLYVAGRDGLHSRVGMAMSSYALQRTQHNDPYNFVKWFAAGFMCRESKGGYKRALYASS